MRDLQRNKYVAFENFISIILFIYICDFSDFSTNKAIFLFLIVGSKCIAIGMGKRAEVSALASAEQ